MGGESAAAVAGVLAGLGVALPLGAIGVLLVQESVVAGWRRAAAGALGVGTVDLLYGVVAVLAGASVSPALEAHRSAVRLVGAAVLTGVAVRGLLHLRRAVRSPEPAPVTSSPLRVFGRFVMLTAVNPLTAVYFVALAAGSSSLVHGSGRASAFLAGVFAGSLAWQLVLVTTAALAGSRLGARARLATGVLGHLIVLGYAVRMVARAG